MVQRTKAQENRGTGRASVRQGEYRPREPTLHEALSNIMGAYHHSQETMAAVLAKFQAIQRLQEEQYFGVQGGTQNHQYHPGHHCRGAEGPREHQEGHCGTTRGP
ncbi:hypothetical protein NDU88_012136 [Pleurodeles waltl]|uniref:Uncharacterized protein n=1 Tax=Pleurodeles waltl TaxID=8319 RepID=A0AAV7R0M8_PLEWA|nr:hypothetical protein NDU88_012136 [Pleurodeles waltl]